MRHLAPTLLLLAVLFTFPSITASAPVNDDPGPTKLSPLQIGQIFCIARVGNDMAPIEAIVTPSLKKAIAKADALEAAWQKKDPGEEPPLGDGLPWQGSQDYTTQCTADGATATDKDASVHINYLSSDDAAANYTDTLMLKPVANAEMGDNVWRIDDVAFGNKHTMRGELVDAFKP